MKKVNNRVNNGGKKKRKQGRIRMLVSAFALTGVCSALAYGISSSVLAMELSRKETIPTSYPVAEEQTKNAENSKNKEMGPVDYKVLADELYGNEQPGKNELGMEDAAQMGVNMIEQLYDVDLKDAYVYMGYSAGTITFPRAFWSGDIRLTDAERKPGDICYGFSIDAVTGEYFNGSMDRNIQAQASLGLDSSLENSSGEFAQAAVAFVNSKGLLRTPAAKVEYHCQGYAGNDPDITFLVYGEDGERVNVTFSRYDKAFKGFLSESSLTISEKALNDFSHDNADGAEQETEKAAAVLE